MIFSLQFVQLIEIFSKNVCIVYPVNSWQGHRPDEFQGDFEEFWKAEYSGWLSYEWTIRHDKRP